MHATLQAHMRPDTHPDTDTDTHTQGAQASTLAMPAVCLTPDCAGTHGLGRITTGNDSAMPTAHETLVELASRWA